MIAVWADARAGGSNLSIAGQRLDADENALWAPTGSLIGVTKADRMILMRHLGHTSAGSPASEHGR